MENKGHILFFGFTTSAEAALKEMETEINERGVIILSKNKVPEIPGVTHLALDYFKLRNLRREKVGLKKCSVCVIFAEFKSGETPRIVDMHTVLTVYNIRKENPDIHIIAEIIDRENTTIINDLKCDDIIFKEIVDFNLITGCILHPNISPIIYDLLTVRGKQLKQTTVEEIGLSGENVTYKDIRLHGLEQDVTYLGYIADSGAVQLMPANSEKILPDYRLVYIE